MFLGAFLVHRTASAAVPYSTAPSQKHRHRCVPRSCQSSPANRYRPSADLLPPCDVGSSEGEGASPVECIANAGIPKWFARPRSVGAQTNPASHGRGRLRARAARWPIPIRWLLKLLDAHISKDQLPRGTVRTSDCSLSDDPGKIRSILSARRRFAQ